MTRRRNKRRASEMLAGTPQSTQEFEADRDAGDDGDELQTGQEPVAGVREGIGRMLPPFAKDVKLTDELRDDARAMGARSDDEAKLLLGGGSDVGAMFLGDREREPSQEETARRAEELADAVQQPRNRKAARLMVATETVYGEHPSSEGEEAMTEDQERLQNAEKTLVQCGFTRREDGMWMPPVHGEWPEGKCVDMVRFSDHFTVTDTPLRTSAPAQLPGLQLEPCVFGEHATADALIVAACSMYGGVLMTGKHTHDLDAVMGECVHRALRMRTMVESALESERTEASDAAEERACRE